MRTPFVFVCRQIMTPEDIDRMAELDLVPSMQATHLTSDMRFLQSRLGDRRVFGPDAYASPLKVNVLVLLNQFPAYLNTVNCTLHRCNLGRFFECSRGLLPHPSSL